MKKIFLSLALLLSVNAAEKSKLQNEMALETLTAVFSGDESVVRANILPGYIQHSPMVQTGLEPTVKAALRLKGSKVTCPRVFDDKEYSVLHCLSTVKGKQKVTFQIFRFTEGKIIERWANGTKKSDLNPSKRSQIDGEVKIGDLEKTEENKAFIFNFAKEVLVDGKIEKLPSYFQGNDYIQHNSLVGDGVDALIDSFKDGNNRLKFQKIHAVLGKGDFVLLITEALLEGKRMSVYDLFRVQNGKVAEHWDVVSQIPPKEKHKNKNGVFGFSEKLVKF